VAPEGPRAPKNVENGGKRWKFTRPTTVLKPVAMWRQVGAEVRDGDSYGNTCVHYAALRGQVRLGLSLSHACLAGGLVSTRLHLLSPLWWHLQPTPPS
jgi:hypothetical protein